MKQFFTFFALLCVTMTMSAQKQIVWFDAGLKAQYGGGGFFNSAIGFDNGYQIGRAFSYGGKLGINKDYNGLSLEVMRNSAEQGFDTGTTIEWKSWDIYALFRNAKNLGYFEIGPKVSLISSVTDNIDGSSVDRTSNYNKNVYSGVIGFGANIMGNEDRFSGILGLRFEYAFTDFVNDAGQAASAPLRQPSIYSGGYKSTNIAFAGVVFELNWGIGYYGKAQCGKRSKFVMF